MGTSLWYCSTSYIIVDFLKIIHNSQSSMILILMPQKKETAEKRKGIYTFAKNIDIKDDIVEVEVDVEQ